MKVVAAELSGIGKAMSWALLAEVQLDQCLVMNGASKDRRDEVKQRIVQPTGLTGTWGDDTESGDMEETERDSEMQSLGTTGPEGETIVTAIAPYAAQGEGEMSFSAGDKFVLLQRGDIWGWIYVQALAENESSGKASHSCAARGLVPTCHLQAWTTAWDWIGEHADELTFGRGAQLVLLGRSEDVGWYYADLLSAMGHVECRGLVPCAHLLPLDSPAAAGMCEDTAQRWGGREAGGARVSAKRRLRADHADSSKRHMLPSGPLVGGCKETGSSSDARPSRLPVGSKKWTSEAQGTSSTPASAKLSLSTKMPVLTDERVQGARAQTKPKLGPRCKSGEGDGGDAVCVLCCNRGGGARSSGAARMHDMRCGKLLGPLAMHTHKEGKVRKDGPETKGQRERREWWVHEKCYKFGTGGRVENVDSEVRVADIDTAALRLLVRRGATQVCCVCRHGGAVLTCRACSSGGRGDVHGGGGEFYHFACADLRGAVEWHWLHNLNELVVHCPAHRDPVIEIWWAGDSDFPQRGWFPAAVVDGPREGLMTVLYVTPPYGQVPPYLNPKP